MTHRDLLLLSLLAASICPSSTVAQSSARSSCRGAEREDYFRAWEGRWVVRDSRGTLAGHNTVSISLDECVLREHYATPSGFESEGITAFDEARQVWHQTWVDNDGQVLVLEGDLDDTELVLIGETRDPEGNIALRRITYSAPDPSGTRARRRWERSSDGGRTWATDDDQAYLRQSSGADWDVLIRGGTVVDGSGDGRFVADVAVRDDRIVRVSRAPLDPSRATRVIDATGHVVSPGFVDIHTHLDPLLELPGGESHIRQGVTTALGGPDGTAPWPLDAYQAEAEALGLGLNVGFMVGHNTVRREVMGLANRAPTADELEQMRAMVAEGMDQGAWGLSTGLKYLPGAFSRLDEVVALSRVAGSRGGFYTSHLREEGLGLLDGVAEALEIGRLADIPIVLTHHKVVGQPMWGSSAQTLAMVDSARTAGTDVMIDQYPYTASYSGITILVPAWAMAGGTDSLLARAAHPVLGDSVLRGIEYNIVNDRGGNDLRRVQFGLVPWDRTLEGLTLHDWAVRDGLEPTPANGARLVIEAVRRGGASGIYHAMDEQDVEAIMRHPQTMIGSDGRLVALGDGHPHPRWYGTFPRVLGRYTRERGILSLEEAIRKMTAMPAERIGLRQRGQVRSGWFADLVVFDASTVADRSTFQEPHQYPDGIDWVLVNGRVTVADGAFLDVRAGSVLKRGRN